jgi:hypothetical protein
MEEKRAELHLARFTLFSPVVNYVLCCCFLSISPSDSDHLLFSLIFLLLLLFATHKQLHSFKQRRRTFFFPCTSFIST